jgi:hypothetical protein
MENLKRLWLGIILIGIVLIVLGATVFMDMPLYTFCFLFPGIMLVSIGAGSRSQGRNKGLRRGR